MPLTPLSWTGIYPVATRTLDAPLLMHPKGDRMLGYSILPMLDTRKTAARLAEKLREVDRTLIELGAKAYLSGNVGYGREEWAEHYGEKLDLGARWKRKFDPNGVFQGEGMPFGESPSASIR